MDGGTFDRLTRLLTGQVSRRAGVLGALAGGLDAAASRGQGPRKGRDGGGAGPRPEGPCGSGRRKDNICTKNSQCCTGFCDLDKSRFNNDRKGRCRCVKRGGTCAKGQTCCTGLTCDGKTCSRAKPKTVPTAARCVAGSTCADPEALCTAYTGQGAPTGTFCTLPLGTRCEGDPDCTCYRCGIPNTTPDAPPGPNARREREAQPRADGDLACCHAEVAACQKNRHCCTGWACESGNCCAVADTACSADDQCCSGLLCESGVCKPCVETVCADGCAYSSVNAAYAAATAGDTIYIGPGTYPTGIIVTKDITLSACPGVTDVILEPDRLVKDGNDSYYAVMTSGPGPEAFSVTLNNLTLKASALGITEKDEALLSNIGGTVNWTMDNCTMTDAYYVVYSVGGDLTISNSTMTRNWYIASLYYQDRASNVKITDCVIKENLDGYLLDYYYGDTYDITLDVQRTTFDANESYIYADAWNQRNDPAQRARSTATFTDCTITNNTQFLQAWGGVVTFTNCTITGNTETPIEHENGNLILNNTIVSGNTGYYSEYYQFSWGGGIRFSADSYNASLTLGPGTKITDNTAQYGAGLFTDQYNATLSMNGVNNTTVFANNGPNCSRFIPPTPPEVPNCAYP